MPSVFDALTVALADRYRIAKTLGAGGMATVYLAEDVKHHRRVALKVLRPELAAALGPDRFLREIEIAAQLQHPHILPLYDSGHVEIEADGRRQELLYYVMPFVEGESLSDKIAREGALPIPEATRIVREVADALAYAHQHGVVHRDIKPDNVMLSGNHALVADFGVAKAVSAATENAALTATGMAIGTPAYMAPEQATADPNADHRVDLYALGALAYEALTGRPPFTGPTAQAVLAHHIADSPDPITRHRPTIPQPLAQLVMRCLEKLPADRVQRADEVVHQLEMVATPISGTTPVVAVTSPAPVRVAAIYAAAAAGVLGVVYALVLVIGLPNWVLVAAAVLMLIGLPIMLVTSHVERGAAQGGVARWFTWRRAILGGVLAFAGLSILVAGYMTMRVLGVGPVGTLMATGVMGDRERIILADFVDRSGDSSLAYAVTEAFRVDLSQSPSVRLVQTTELNDAFARMNRPVPAVMTVDLAREVAQREGFRAVVAGEIHEVGASFVISAQLLGAESGEVLVPLRETAGDSSGIIAAVDRLSSRLRERIGESLRSIRRSAALERVTTASLPALRKFSQATRAVEASQPALAIAFFKEAIALDTAFAAAHRGLAIVLRNWGIDRALAARSMSNAYRFRDRLTESERLWTTGTYHMTRNEAQQALVPYLELLEREPSNARVLNNIGVLYSVGQDNQRALEYYLRAHEAEPGNTSATFNIVVTLLDLGLIDSARAVNRRFAERAPGHPLVHAHDYIINSVTMEYDSADAAVDRWAPSIDESSAAVLHTVRIRLAGVRGRSSRVHAQLGEAESRARAGRQVPEFLRMAIEAALYDLTTRGTPGSALARLDGLLTAFPLDGLEPVDRPYLELADAYARAGRADRAREYVAAFDREVIDEYKPLAETAYDLALGSVALAMQDAEAAVAAFRRAGRIGCRVCALPGLARAYELRGELDSALAMYERYVRTPDDDRTNTDYVELPRSYVRLGELFEARGAREQAVEYYNRFVELWSTADAELEPLVDDIRQRIARLVAEGR